MTNEILEQNTIQSNFEDQKEGEVTIPGITGNQSGIATVFDGSQGIERQGEGFDSLDIDNQGTTPAHA